ncbi:MAG: DUF5615 family PIN-like protein [bacterium]
MKLLFDENVSFKLAEKLADVYPESAHVRSVGLTGARDHDIWDFASAEGFTIVSKDDDFRQLSILRGAPPKVMTWHAVPIPNVVGWRCPRLRPARRKVVPRR